MGTSKWPYFHVAMKCSPYLLVCQSVATSQSSKCLTIQLHASTLHSLQFVYPRSIAYFLHSRDKLPQM